MTTGRELRWWGLLLAVAGCGWFSATPIPDVAPAPPAAAVPSPYAAPGDAEAVAARAWLEARVRAHGLTVDLPWALGHALLALGPEVTLPDGRRALDALFAAQARAHTVGGRTILRFPSRDGDVVVEPHEALMLKVVTDLGLPPDRGVTVQGTTHPLGALWRGALYDAWIDGSRTGFASWNDSPWALHGLSAWAPDDLAWTADGGHAMTLDGFTHAVVSRLHDATKVVAAARRSGQPLDKKGQGIFGFTCGGAHLLQGAAAAVGRGFGTPDDRETMEAEADLARWRFDAELALVDGFLDQAPEYRLILTVQRLKFVGHTLESLHTMAALGLIPADDPAVRADLDRVEAELVRTVGMLDAMGIPDRMAGLAASEPQIFLDLIGDSAHAVRGLDLAHGDATVVR